jgi:hypothetical protein
VKKNRASWFRSSHFWLVFRSARFEDKQGHSLVTPNISWIRRFQSSGTLRRVNWHISTVVSEHLAATNPHCRPREATCNKGLRSWIRKPVGVLFCGWSHAWDLPKRRRRLRTRQGSDPIHANAKWCPKISHVRFLQGLSNALFTGQPVTGHYTVFSYWRLP